MNDDLLIPIEEARNLGSATGQALREIGVTNLYELKKLGWEQVCLSLAMNNPNFINLNAFTAIIGAIRNEDWRAIDPDLKLEAQKLLNALKR